MQKNGIKFYFEKNDKKNLVLSPSFSRLEKIFKIFLAKN